MSEAVNSIMGIEAPVEASALSYFHSRPGPLYALIDAARQPANVALLRESEERHQSLYAGDTAAELVNVSPYLVELRADSRVLAKLATEGWDDAWGYCIATRCPFAELRTHFRKFLLITLHDGREAYFRFYDPRVLRTFLGTSTREQAAKFFESIDEILCPGAMPGSLARYRLIAGELQVHEAPFVAWMGAASHA